MAKTSFYGVKSGRTPGVYTTWSDCEAQVKGFPGAIYKKFSTEKDAQDYVSLEHQDESKFVSEPKPTGALVEQESETADLAADKAKAYEYLKWMKSRNLLSDRMFDMVSQHIDTRALYQEMNVPSSHVAVYVDGSFNSDTEEYGYGVYMDDGVNKQILYGRDRQVEGGRNVEGEVAASKAALEALHKSGKYDSVKLYHDYQGIGSWADGEWKANKSYTRDYAAFVKSIRDSGMKVEFVHVDGHTGVRGNEYVDKIAKMACGVPVTNSDKNLVAELRNVYGYQGLMEHAAAVEAGITSKQELEQNGIVSPGPLFE